MFTGIVEEVGTIRNVIFAASSAKIQVEAGRVVEETKVGDSIAVNGICLTVTQLLPWGFTADLMPETIRATSLAGLGRGSRINLERAMTPTGRMGGHIVTGHIDGVGRLRSKTKEANAVWLEIEPEEKILDSLINKGSIAIDGVSLTLAGIGADSFKVSIIPHTGQETILLEKEVGDRVNLETDIIGKYVKRFLENMEPEGKTRDKKETGIDWEFLAKHGY